MFIKSLLRLHSYRKFDYKPRFYDDTKEQREKRALELKRDRTLSETLNKTNYRNEWQSNNRMHSSSAASFRVAVIFTILCILAYSVLRFTKISVF